MKYSAWILLAFGTLFGREVSHEFRDVATVYMLPMAGGLDQYLASKLTSGGILQVVTDPQKADAVFTDRLGEAFERQMSQLYPPPKDEDEEEDAKTVKGDSQTPLFGSGRAKGNVFLVSRKTRNVIWSIHVPPRGLSPSEMDRASEQIARNIKRDRVGK